MKKYTSACLYVIIDDKENLVFYEFDKSEVYVLAGETETWRNE